MDSDNTFPPRLTRHVIRPRPADPLPAPPSPRFPPLHAGTEAAGKTGSGDVRPRRGRPPGKRVPTPEEALTIHVDTTPSPRTPIAPEDREKGRAILDDIGKRFSANRKRGKSTAYEEYQSDLAHNSQYLIAGGLLSVKELSELLMRIEEFRKSTTERGETPATLLAKWLMGEKIEGVQ